MKHQFFVTSAKLKNVSFNIGFKDTWGDIEENVPKYIEDIVTCSFSSEAYEDCEIEYVTDDFDDTTGYSIFNVSILNTDILINDENPVNPNDDLADYINNIIKSTIKDEVLDTPGILFDIEYTLVEYYQDDVFGEDSESFTTSVNKKFKFSVANLK